MHALFCHDTYYCRDKSGRVYAYGAFPYKLWAERFLPYFDSITIIGREKAFIPADVKGLDISSGENVNHILLPNINAPLKRLLKGREIYNQISKHVTKADAIIIRGPVEFGMMAARAARKAGKSYAVEMSGCAFDNVWSHGSLIGKIYAPLKYIRARSMVSHAGQVVYVTEKFLQNRYPTLVQQTYASNVELDPSPVDILQKRLATISDNPKKITFGLIGNFGNTLKGLDVCFKALSMIKDHLPHFELRLLGQGDPAQWKDQIGHYGLNGHVVFTGPLKGGKPVLDWLDDIDIYLQPSLHEGLPRSLIEAMSRACPALGSDAGGIPELLPQSFIHEKGNAEQLAKQMLNMVSKTEIRTRAAESNFEKAQKYTKDKLQPRRDIFWSRFAERVKEQVI